MFWTNVKRVVRAGFIDFWRTGFVSFSALLMMIITLFVIGSLIFINATLTSTLNQIQNKVDINVYFVKTASEDDILSMKKSIEVMPEVESVEYISREQALADFRLRHATDQLTLQALDELGENPLGAVLNIKAKDPSQYAGIAGYLQSPNALSSSGSTIIDKVNYTQNKVAIERLSGLIDSGKRFGSILTVVLVVLSILITYNTIRLAIYTSREEISVMKLVGAGNTFVRAPFVVSGMIYGVLSALLTLALFFPLAYWIGPKTEYLGTGINVFTYYLANFFQIFLVLVLSGIGIAAISSYLAVRKYLKV